MDIWEKAAMEIIANEAEIKQAMGALRLDNWADVLDEIELNRRLEISLAQADRGETMPLEELERRTAEKMDTTQETEGDEPQAKPAKPTMECEKMLDEAFS